jgi:hypothetical protein
LIEIFIRLFVARFLASGDFEPGLVEVLLEPDSIVRLSAPLGAGRSPEP